MKKYYKICEKNYKIVEGSVKNYKNIKINKCILIENMVFDFK